MSLFGILNLFCPICGHSFRYDQDKPGPYAHHSEFGILCGRQCLDIAQEKYAKMILGHDEGSTVG